MTSHEPHGVSNHRPPWRRYQIETFSALLAICAGNSPVTGEFPTKRPVTRSFDIFFDMRLNKRMSKQSWGWWFETPSRSLWRHCNDAAPPLPTVSTVETVQQQTLAVRMITGNSTVCSTFCSRVNNKENLTSPYYWPFVWLPMDSPHKGPVM